MGEGRRGRREDEQERTHDLYINLRDVELVRVVSKCRKGSAEIASALFRFDQKYDAASRYGCLALCHFLLFGPALSLRSGNLLAGLW